MTAVDCSRISQPAVASNFRSPTKKKISESFHDCCRASVYLEGSMSSKLATSSSNLNAEIDEALNSRSDEKKWRSKRKRFANC
jgi:hypothetical protein